MLQPFAACSPGERSSIARGVQSIIHYDAAFSVLSEDGNSLHYRVFSTPRETRALETDGLAFALSGAARSPIQYLAVKHFLILSPFDPPTHFCGAGTLSAAGTTLGSRRRSLVRCGTTGSCTSTGGRGSAVKQR